MNSKYGYIRVYDPPPAYRIMNLQNIKYLYRCLQNNYGEEVIRISDLLLTLYRDDLPDLQKRIDTQMDQARRALRAALGLSTIESSPATQTCGLRQDCQRQSNRYLSDRLTQTARSGILRAG